ncbi:MAG: 50S ribosomal protein L15 [Planctomycetes bacterium]|nr:50S ribosomal protein L15 [Planctomycetota bacterium]
MNLNDIKAEPSGRKRVRRLGRGRSSGRGKTSGRGTSGERARSGRKGPGIYEGGQMPLFRRLPKRGFNNKVFAKRFAIVNTGGLNRFQDGDEVDPAALLKAGLTKRVLDGVKVLANGELKRKLTVKAHRFSQAALEKIQAAGGTAVVL